MRWCGVDSYDEERVYLQTGLASCGPVVGTTRRRGDGLGFARRQTGFRAPTDWVSRDSTPRRQLCSFGSEARSRPNAAVAAAPRRPTSPYDAFTASSFEASSPFILQISLQRRMQ